MRCQSSVVSGQGPSESDSSNCGHNLSRGATELRRRVAPRLAETSRQAAALHQTFSAYARSQFQKIDQDLRNHGEVRWKHVMHLMRLLLSGVTVLREGYVPVRVERYRDELLAIRRGEMAWAEIDRWRLALHDEMDAALSATALPDEPDRARANAFLIRARRAASKPDWGG